MPSKKMAKRASDMAPQLNESSPTWARRTMSLSVGFYRLHFQIFLHCRFLRGFSRWDRELDHRLCHLLCRSLGRHRRGSLGREHLGRARLLAFLLHRGSISLGCKELRKWEGYINLYNHGMVKIKGTFGDRNLGIRMRLCIIPSCEVFMYLSLYNTFKGYRNIPGCGCNLFTFEIDNKSFNLSQRFC
jgi:hypothetical protein